MAEYSEDLTTLICLFHHKDAAHAALEDILKAGVPESNVTLVGDEGSVIAGNGATLEELNVPERDRQRLLDGLKDGGAVLTVSAISSLADKVEAIFADHKADKIDEAVVDDDMSGSAVPATLAGEDLEADDLEEDDLLEEGDPQEIPAPPYNSPDVRFYRVVALPPATTEDVDPRELGLDAKMAPHE